MKRNLCRVLWALLALATLGLHTTTLALSAPRYNIIDLGTLGGNDSIAYGINNSGQVVGFSQNAPTESPDSQAFLWKEGTMNALPYFGGHNSNSNALDINNFGQVVGYSNEEAVLWQNGEIIALGTTGIDNSPAYAINDAGHIVGFQHTSSIDSSSPYHAWLWDSVNGLQDIDTTGCSFAYDINDAGIIVGRAGSPVYTACIWQDGEMMPVQAFRQFEAINNFGQIVGVTEVGNQLHAALWDDGEITVLGVLDGTTDSSARDINNFGQVVGNSGAGYNERAFLWENGTMIDLNDLVDADPGFILATAYGINDLGQIVGYGEIDGYRHAFLLTPIPKPVEIDIKPASCPNPVNTKSKGVLPVAILGTEDFDVSEIDVSTVLLEGVAPIRYDWDDMATSYNGFSKDDCLDCTEEGPDGFMDLTLKFDTQELVAALGEINDGDCMPLMITGELFDGTPIEGSDLVVILKKGK